MTTSDDALDALRENLKHRGHPYFIERSEVRRALDEVRALYPKPIPIQAGIDWLSFSLGVAVGTLAVLVALLIGVLVVS